MRWLLFWGQIQEKIEQETESHVLFSASHKYVESELYFSNRCLSSGSLLSGRFFFLPLLLFCLIIIPLLSLGPSAVNRSLFENLLYVRIRTLTLSPAEIKMIEIRQDQKRDTVDLYCDAFTVSRHLMQKRLILILLLLIRFTWCFHDEGGDGARQPQLPEPWCVSLFVCLIFHECHQLLVAVALTEM